MKLYKDLKLNESTGEHEYISDEQIINENKGIYKVFVLKSIEGFEDENFIKETNSDNKTPLGEINAYLSGLDTGDKKNSSLYLQLGYIPIPDYDELYVNITCCKFTDHENKKPENPNYKELVSLFKKQFPNHKFIPTYLSNNKMIQFNVSSMAADTKTWSNSIDLNGDKKYLDLDKCELTDKGIELVKNKLVEVKLFENLTGVTTPSKRKNKGLVIVMYIE